MSANDPADPEMPALKALLEDYRSQYNIAEGEPFERSTVEHLYKMDEDFTAYDIAPPVGGYVGWAAYAQAWSKVLSKYREIRFTFRDDVRIFRRGDVAWMSFSSDWTGRTAGGEEFAKEMRMTLIWVREDGRWQLTHEHGSSPRTTTLPGGETV